MIGHRNMAVQDERWVSLSNEQIQHFLGMGLIYPSQVESDSGSDTDESMPELEDTEPQEVVQQPMVQEEAVRAAVLDRVMDHVRVIRGLMQSLENVEDVPIDVARGLYELRELFEEDMRDSEEGRDESEESFNENEEATENEYDSDSLSSLSSLSDFSREE